MPEPLKEIAPDVTHAAVLMHLPTAVNVAMFNATVAAGPSFGMQVTAAGIADPAGVERAVAAHAREPAGGLIVLPHVVTAGHRELIARLALAASRVSLPRRLRTTAHGGKIATVNQRREAS